MTPDAYAVEAWMGAMAVVPRPRRPVGEPTGRPEVDALPVVPAGLGFGPARRPSEVEAAGTVARHRYPGPVGELLATELELFGASGGRPDHDGLLARLTRHLVDPGGRP